MVSAFLWVLSGPLLWERCMALGRLCVLTMVCFIGIHLANSLPSQVQATGPSNIFQKFSQPRTSCVHWGGCP
ncbi:hypothetical protein [Candidatus Cyanaurora vandensis]|uniref:hypothetical protein n=1 Tax=Candidatus Cyanaurora vandensis TaxID=2714958 RepID=UPI00257EF8F8|nr:hypothetical protein [Candidatus Cyanaurora vandensis]